MLQWACDLFSYTVVSEMQEIGRLCDLLVEAPTYVVRHVVVNRSTGLVRGGDVAVPISAITMPEMPKHDLIVALSPDEIEQAEDVGLAHRPTRSTEIALFSRLHWQPYWKSEKPSAPRQLLQATRIMSTSVDSAGETIGSVHDLLIDCAAWVVELLRLQIEGETGPFETLVPAEAIGGLDCSAQHPILVLDDRFPAGFTDDCDVPTTPASLQAVRRRYGLQSVRPDRCPPG